MISSMEGYAPFSLHLLDSFFISFNIMLTIQLHKKYISTVLKRHTCPSPYPNCVKKSKKSKERKIVLLAGGGPKQEIF